MKAKQGRAAARKTAASKAQVEAPNEAEIEPEIPDEELSIEDRIRAAFGQVGESDQVSVQISKLVEGNNRPEAYLFSCAPDDLDNIMDKVRDGYGSGNYRVRIRKNRRIAGQFDFSVYVPPKAALPVAPPAQDSALVAMMERLVQSNERLQERLSASPAASGGVDGELDRIVKLTTALKVLAPPPPPAVDLAGIIGIVKSGVDLFREMGIGGGGDSDDGMWSVLKEAVKRLPLDQIIAGAMTMPGQAALSAQIAPLNDPARSPPPQQQVPPLIAMLRQPVAYLVTRAARNASPDLYAEWLLDNLPADAPDEVIEALIARPDLLQVLIAAVPEVQNYGAWFLRLIEVTRDMLTEETNDKDDAGRSPAADNLGSAPAGSA